MTAHAPRPTRLRQLRASAAAGRAGLTPLLHHAQGRDQHFRLRRVAAG